MTTDTDNSAAAPAVYSREEFERDQLGATGERLAARCLRCDQPLSSCECDNGPHPAQTTDRAPADDASVAQGGEGVLWTEPLCINHGASCRNRHRLLANGDLEIAEVDDEDWVVCNSPTQLVKTLLVHLATLLRDSLAAHAETKLALERWTALASEYAMAARSLNGSKESRERLGVAHGALLSAALTGEAKP